MSASGAPLYRQNVSSSDQLSLTSRLNSAIRSLYAVQVDVFALRVTTHPTARYLVLTDELLGV